MDQKVTGLKVQTKNPGRVNVYLDGEFAFGLARITAAWLQVGQELSEEKIAELKAADEKEVALQKTLNFLNYRARSVKEVRRYLEGKKYPDELISGILERLQQNGLLNDQTFAEGWVDNRKEFRPRSKRALRMELRQRGVSDDAIEAAVEDVDDEEQAYQAGIKQSRKWNELEPQDFRKKMYEFLSRRGFNYEVIAPVTRRIWEELSSAGLENDEEI